MADSLEKINIESCWRCSASKNNIYLDDFGLKCFKCGFLQDQEKVMKIAMAKVKHTVNLRTTWKDGALRRRLKKREEQGVKARLNRKIKVEFPK